MHGWDPMTEQHLFKVTGSVINSLPISSQTILLPPILWQQAEFCQHHFYLFFQMKKTCFTLQPASPNGSYLIQPKINHQTQQINVRTILVSNLHILFAFCNKAKVWKWSRVSEGHFFSTSVSPPPSAVNSHVKSRQERLHIWLRVTPPAAMIVFISHSSNQHLVTTGYGD